MSHGFMGQIGYTWSHGLDVISNGGLGEYFSYNDSLTSQINPFITRALNYSSSDYDVRHDFTVDFLWESPWKFNSKAAQQVLGGWSVATKWYARTSTPFSVFSSTKAGSVSSSLGGTVLADVIGAAPTCGRAAVDKPCFTSANFLATSKQIDFGNMPRNSFRGPGYFDVDTSIYKAIAIRERVKLTVGGSLYNLLNHANFANPSGNTAAGGLGSISSTVTPPASPYGSFQGSAVSGRVIVLTGKFSF